MKIRLAALCAVLSCLSALAPLQAEFLQTSPGVYQNPAGTEKVIVSYAVPGLFILTGPPVDIQLFDPARLDGKGTQHVFVEYDAPNSSYSALLVGKERFKINGSFILEIGGLRIAVDNNNPYLSIVDDKESSILGFRGTEPVVNLASEVAITFLEANQFNQYGSAIAPYTLAEGRLMLRGAPFQRDSIGLKLEPPRNPCLEKSKVIYLNEEEIVEIKKITSNDERLRRLDEKLKERKKYDPLAESLLAQITKESLISLNYLNGSVKSIRPMQNKLAKTTICVVTEIQF